MKLEQTHTQQDFRKNNGENADNAACILWASHLFTP